jgi:small subunit ribosomal protein S16
MVKIRLARLGRKKLPLFTIVATDHRNPRDGKFLEKLGQYNPKETDGKQLNAVKAENLRAWLNKGAGLSDTVKALLKRNNVKY